jgi:hypothetical protein
MVLLLLTLNLNTTFFPRFFSHHHSLLLRRSATIRRKFHLYPRTRTVACSRLMDSPEDGLSAPLLDSVTQDFKNLIPKKKNLEDLNWDNSFVRELPSDPRTDPYPREVALTFIQFISIQMEIRSPIYNLSL